MNTVSFNRKNCFFPIIKTPLSYPMFTAVIRLHYYIKQLVRKKMKLLILPSEEILLNCAFTVSGHCLIVVHQIMLCWVVIRVIQLITNRRGGPFHKVKGHRSFQFIFGYLSCKIKSFQRIVIRLCQASIKYIITRSCTI